MGEVLPFPAALEGLAESPWKKISAPEKKLEVFKCERPLRLEQWESSVHTHHLKQIPGFGGKPQAFPLPPARTWNGICLVIVMRRGRKPAFLCVCIKLGFWSPPPYFFKFPEKKLVWVYWVKNAFSKRALHPCAPGRVRFRQKTSQ